MEFRVVLIRKDECFILLFRIVQLWATEHNQRLSVLYGLSLNAVDIRELAVRLHL